jgi:hypothetical protein
MYYGWGEIRDEYKILVQKHKAKSPLGRPRCRQEDNIKHGSTRRRMDGVDWIGLAHDGVQ